MYTAAAVHGHYSRPVPIIDHAASDCCQTGQLLGSISEEETQISVIDRTDQIAVHQYYRTPLMGQDQ